MKSMKSKEVREQPEVHSDILKHLEWNESPRNIGRIADELKVLRHSRSDIEIFQDCFEDYLDPSNRHNQFPFQLNIDEIKHLSANYNSALLRLDKEGIIRYLATNDEFLGVVYAAQNIRKTLIENVKDDYTIYDMFSYPLKSQKDTIHTLDIICARDLDQVCDTWKINFSSLIHHDHSILGQEQGELASIPIEAYNLYKFSLDVFLKHLDNLGNKEKPITLQSFRFQRKALNKPRV